MRALQAPAKTCFHQHVAGAPKRFKIEVELEISAAGAVKKVKASTKDGPSAMARCIEQGVAKLTLDPGEERRLMVPLSFQSQ